MHALAANNRLNRLGLNNNQIGDAGAFALSKNASIKELLVGGIVGNKISDNGVAALAGNPVLTSLDLSANDVGPKGLNALIKNTHIVKLGLAKCHLDERALQAISHLNIKKLNLEDSEIGNRGATILANMLALTHLNARHNQITSPGAQALAKNSTIKKLNLENNNIGEDGIIALAKNTSLTHLSVLDSELTEKGAEYLGNNKTLESLEVKGLSGYPLQTLLLNNANLKKLIIYDGKFSIEDMQLLAENKTLVTLSLFLGNVSDEYMEILAKNTHIKSYDLGYNQIHDRGMFALAKNNTIRKLHIETNPFTKKGFDAIVHNKNIILLSHDFLDRLAN